LLLLIFAVWLPFHLSWDDYCSDEMKGDVGGGEEAGMNEVFPGKAEDH